MQLTKNFTLAELTQSAYADRQHLDNTPTPEIVSELVLTAKLLQDIRDYLSSFNGRDTPLINISGYRSILVNRGVGSSDKSDHVIGMAADFNAIGIKPYDVCQLLLPKLDEFGIGQIANERTWVHVSRKPQVKEVNRVITIDKLGTRAGIVQVRN
jgi:zinc D-Ala-D-Ala carboxypeptidase